MKLDDLSPRLVVTAIGAYLELAYGGSSSPRQRPEFELPDDAGRDEILALFQKQDPGGACASYTLRLGNRNYPFMKLVLQEHIVPGEFYFAVDTHDDMSIKPDYPDYEAWMAVRRFNSALKQEIEARFAELELPTASTLRDLCRTRDRSSEVREGSATILVVDDEEDLADAVESILEARGYHLYKAHDGRAGLELARRVRPDMILLDYELPELDGLEVLAELRKSEDTRAIPVLLCTASKISVGDIRKADGFLAKPYQEELLYSMVNRILDGERRVAP